MSLLIAGVTIWVVAHLMPAVAPSFRQSLIERTNENAYRGLFSLVILGSVVLIVLGWRSTPEQFIYVLPPDVRLVAFILICLAFVLIGAAQYPTRIKHFIRHPMLAGVFVWAAAHLLVNGTVRAMVLFGTLGVWALLEIILINRRDGDYTKPDAPGFGRELRGFSISVVVILVVLFLHPYFAGVSPFPR